jgi:hypothetical protein
VWDILEPAQFAKELEPKRKLTAAESVDRLKVLARFEQLRNLVSRGFNVSKYLFARFLRIQNEHKKEITLGPEPVLDVNEVTNELARVVIARRSGTWIRAKEQRQVETHLDRAINDRGFLSKPVKTVPAVSALAGISLHRNTPCPAPTIAVKIRERSSKRQKLSVPKSVLPPIRN